MRLFNQIIAACSRDDLDVLHSVEHVEFSNGCSITPELIGVDHVWDVITHQKPHEKGLCRLGVPPILQKKIQHCTGTINGPPQPEFLAPGFNADLVQEPPGTPSGFPVPEFFQGSELDVPLAQCLVAYLNAALLKQFLNVALTQGEMVAEPKRVLDDAQWETVAVGLAVSHG